MVFDCTIISLFAIYNSVCTYFRGPSALESATHPIIPRVQKISSNKTPTPIPATKAILDKRDQMFYYLHGSIEGPAAMLDSRRYVMYETVYYSRNMVPRGRERSLLMPEGMPPRKEREITRKLRKKLRN